MITWRRATTAEPSSFHFLPPTLLLFIYFLTSHSFLKQVKNSKNGAEVVRLDSETTGEAGEGLVFSQSHVLVFKDFSINHLILHHQHLFFFLWGVTWCFPPSTLLLLLQDLAADLAAAHFGALLASLQGLLRRRVDELLAGIHGGEPEAVLVGEVVAGALGSVALDERRRAEILQAGAGRDQGLTAALSAGCRVLQTRDLQHFEFFLYCFCFCREAKCNASCLLSTF